jgi:hypothetical protein
MSENAQNRQETSLLFCKGTHDLQRFSVGRCLLDSKGEIIHSQDKDIQRLNHRGSDVTEEDSSSSNIDTDKT